MRILLLSLFCASMATMAVSCSFEPDETGEPATQAPTVSASFLEGSWESRWNDGFTVSGAAFSYQYNGETKFTGDIVNVRTLSPNNESGYLTLRLKTVSPDYSLLKDTYYVVYWASLEGSSVGEGSPWKDGGSNDGFETQAAAEAEYTVTNGYFAWPGTYAKK